MILTVDILHQYDQWEQNLKTLFAMKDIGSFSMDYIAEAAIAFPAAQELLEQLGVEAVPLIRVTIAGFFKDYINQQFESHLTRRVPWKTPAQLN